MAVWVTLRSEFGAGPKNENPARSDAYRSVETERTELHRLPSLAVIRVGRKRAFDAEQHDDHGVSGARDIQLTRKFKGDWI
jgi:hypothetical protein